MGVIINDDISNDDDGGDGSGGGGRAGLKVSPSVVVTMEIVD